MARIPNVEVWVWACTSIALMALRIYPNFLPDLSPDAFQYLSMAEHALGGRLGYTSLIHFDAERSFGAVPAPMVTFPAGYPLAIALASLVGFSLQSAALLVSTASTVACVPLLAWTAGKLGLSRLLCNVVMAGFVFNGAVIDLGIAAISEPLFMFIMLLGVALLVNARFHAETSWGWRWAAAGLIFGAAYFVRYAGLFFVIGLAMLVVRHLIAPSRSLAKDYAVSFTVASVAVLVGMVRNILLVGNWRGGNDKIVDNPLLSILVESARAANRLVLGPGSLGETLIPRALFTALFFTGMVLLIWSYLRQQRVQLDTQPALKGIGLDLLLLVATYSACMFYAGLTSVISYGTRMFVPLTPPLLLLLALALHTMLAALTPAGSPPRLFLLALAACFCFYVFLNFMVFRLPLRDDASSVVAHLGSTLGNEKSARTMVLDLVGQWGVIVANNGQTIGHVLGRPTVSLVGPHYSGVEWNEQSMRDTVKQFNAAAIVIYVPIGDESMDRDFVPSPFVWQLAQGDSPSWMKLVYRSSVLLVYVPLEAL